MVDFLSSKNQTAPERKLRQTLQNAETSISFCKPCNDFEEWSRITLILALKTHERQIARFLR